MQLLPSIKPGALAIILALSIGMFSSWLQAKPGAAISLHSANAYEIPAFSNAHLDIAFALPSKPGRLQVRLQTHEQIKILNQDGVQEFLLDGDEPLLKLPVEIEVSEAGKYYLLFNLIFTSEQGLSEAVSLAVRLQVGDQSVQGIQQKPASPSGIKTLPAVETIK